MSWFDLEAGNEAEEVYSQSGGFERRGEYLVELQECYLVDSDNTGGTGLKVKFKYEDGGFGNTAFWFINGQTKTQRMPDGRPTFGSIQIKQLFGALQINPNSVKPVVSKIEVAKDTFEDKPTFRELFGKKVLVVVQMQENEYNGEITLRPDVIGFFDPKTRKNYKELDEGTEPKMIEKAIKQSQKDRLLKKDNNKAPKQNDTVNNDDNPWA